MIIILFGCLRREVPLVGTTANTMTGSAYSAKIITTPSALSVPISLPRQPLPCPNQGVQCLPHPLATRTRIGPRTRLVPNCDDDLATRPLPQLRAIDGEQLAMVIAPATSVTGRAPKHKVDQQPYRGMILIEC